LRDYVQAASSLPLPLIPGKLDEFPTRWPFPRGDLHHWIPLLNRFDNILEAFCATYKLQEGFQTRDFACDLLLNKGAPVEYGDGEAWSKERLIQLGYKDDGDCRLILSILNFTGVLLQHCGNRSIYASSHHLNDLLNTTSLEVVFATLQVGLELAQRYQASIKRLPAPSRQVSSALLANHYNIDLDRVLCLSQPFVKTPISPVARFADIPPTTPASATKGKDKAVEPGHKSVTVMYANDLTSLIAPGPTDDARWNGWGDVRIGYYPQTESLAQEPQTGDRGPSAGPTTPSPLRRSSTGITQTPRLNRFSGAEDSPSSRSQGASGEGDAAAGFKTIQIRQSTVQSTSIYDLLKLCPADLPKPTRYEFLNRLRICKALLGSSEDRQLALAVRLLAITNLAYIHNESTFAEKVLKQDNDEPRRYQLVYQLAELIHPSVDGAPDTPLRLQAIALAALQAISVVPTKYADVLSALNANVNHGVLLYVVRKAVASMKEDPVEPDEGKVTDADHWRAALFALTLHMAMSSRIGQEMASAGLLEVLVEILNLRSKVASRNYSMVLGFLDNIVYNYQGAFTAFSNASGLDAISNLIVDTVKLSKDLVAAGQGTRPEFHAQLVDYEIPFYQQQTLKWLLKFIHHIMTNAFTFGANTDRLLRNLVDNSSLLTSLRAIIEEMRVFGSVVWTNAATLLGDFINNDPTSFAAISESGMIKSFLQALTGKEVTQPKPPGTPRPDAHDGEDVGSPDYSEDSVIFESDDRPHPPTQEILDAPREQLARGVLASSDAINIIPSVLNSISLNNAGMGMIVAANALDSFLEIFESPEHVQVMSTTDPDLPSNLGSSFDELARHHPALRPTISNAVIDMIARVLHFAKTKSATAGWGAKLMVVDPSGTAVNADDSLIARMEAPVTTSKGKEKSTAHDTDVEMADVALQPPADPPTNNDSEPEARRATGSSDEIAPYVWAASSFLNTLFGNSSLKSTFIREGGIELLLELSEAPSLPEDFETTTASRMLSQVLAQLIEASPVLGVPSLLNRIHAAVQDLQPLVGREGVYPFFAPFIVPDFSLVNDKGEWDRILVRKVASGTRVVKALVKLQTLVKTLYQSFPYSTRHNVVTMPAVNVFDYFTALIKRLGPLLRDIITEEMAIAALVPQHWTGNKPSSQDGAEFLAPAGLTPADGDAQEEEATLPTSGSKPVEPSMQVTKPTREERSTTQFQNYFTIHRLLHSLTPSILPFFQTIGKTLLPRRGADSFVRSNHMIIAEALANTILEQLKMSQEKLTAKNLHYWIMMFHTLREMLIDPTRQTERAGVQLILPVLVAFKELGGLDVLNVMLGKFAEEIRSGATEGEEAHKVRLATVGMKKILDIYHVIVNGKNVNESLAQTSIISRSTDRNRDFGNQLVVELRLAVLPTARKLWESELAEKAPTPVLSRLIDILKTISAADHESNVWRKSDKTSPPSVFKNRETVRFSWASHSEQVSNLTRLDYDEDLAREAVYRANGKFEDTTEYCRAHSKGLAGKRNPIPEEDAYRSPPSPRPQQAQGEGSVISPADALGSSAGPMALDSMPEINNLIRDAIGEAVLGDLGDHSSDESNSPSRESSSQHSASQEASGGSPAQPAVASSGSLVAPQAAPSTAKEDLDKERAELQNDLIDRCLDVVRAHPDSVFEVSDLIHSTILRSDNEDKRTEVGEILANALMSYAMNDDDEKKANGRGIAAYAHLLSLLLQNRPFFKSTLPTLKQNVNEYLGFLKVSPASSSEELPPWMPYILLIFEILLSDDEQPVEAEWKPPVKDDDPVEQPVWTVKEHTVSDEARSDLLTAVLDILPRVGKEEPLAVSVLRILVILTRDHAIAKTVGEKRNLQRLFVMAKQSCSGGSARLNQSHISDNIMIILRHIVEDEELIRQMMQTEIRQYLTMSRGTRSCDVHNYLRHLSHVALRAPKLFVDVTTELVKLARWSSTSVDGAPRTHSLSLKEKTAEQATPPKDGSVEPAVQATEDLTIHDVKPSTEATDKEMTDAPKTPFESKRPVLEHPDGVVHFLLCELLNYREVDDKEPPSQALKESKLEEESPSASKEATPSPADPETSEGKERDRKSSKPTFKAEDHPIFVYRCFLLNCLAELLQSFNRCKVEFINFKRSAPMQTNTPIKPRSSILNYLLNDLLCSTAAGLPTDSTLTKKKAATSHHAQAVLVALVARTPEKPIDRTRDQFEYDDDLDLLFVRRFVLDTVLRAYKEASASSEPFDVRSSKMICTAELMSVMIGEGKDKDNQPKNERGKDPALVRSEMQLKRLMYEKGYLAALTASIADIDLSFPNVKRTIKYILRVLRSLTKTAYQLSQSDIIPATATDQPEDDFASASSLSDLDDDREETPDLYRNSTLGMLEPGREEDSTEESEEGLYS
jgi:E3 ubiquitin-protein ligase HUWE1